jgi:hypothetical protein
MRRIGYGLQLRLATPCRRLAGGNLEHGQAGVEL